MTRVSAEEFAGWLSHHRAAGSRVRAARVAASAETASAYLYANYQVTDASQPEYVTVEGVDVGGFTLDAVIDRLASGLIGAREVTAPAVTWHSYGYEMWPDPLPQASYPMLVPEHVALFVRDGASVVPTAPPGFSVQRVQHNRYQCLLADGDGSAYCLGDRRRRTRDV